MPRRPRRSTRRTGSATTRAARRSAPATRSSPTRGSEPWRSTEGPTETHALLAGSPAIDKGTAPCPLTDQRGISRPRGAACDVGAYEFVPTQSGPPPPPPDDDEELPAPVPHKNVNALPKSGTVRIKLPGSDKFVELQEGQQIPLGTTIDTRKGRVTIVAAAGSGQTADFYAGIFKLSQTKGSKPITVLTLVESSRARRRSTRRTRRLRKRGSGGCGATARGASGPRASTAPRPS